MTPDPLPSPVGPGLRAAESTSAPSLQPEVDVVDAAMERYADGNEDVFPVLFEALAPRLRAFLLRMSGRADVADDLTQEAFLRIHRARATFTRGRTVLPWAYAIARNCYLDHHRAVSRVPVTRGDDAVQDLPTGRETDAEGEFSARRAAECVERVLAQMTPARREAFVLLRYEGLSVEAAAQVLGISEGAVKVRASHAYELLRQALQNGR